MMTEEEFINHQGNHLGINDICSQEDCFDNNPIFLHFSCLNARELGIDLVQNGASAFLGHYNTAGNTPRGFLSELSAGKPIGTVLKNQINRKLSRNLANEIIVASDGKRKNENIDILMNNIALLSGFVLSAFSLYMTKITLDNKHHLNQ